MWSIKILKGPSTGKTFSLQTGETRIGRGTTCQIQINIPGISKEHALITVNGAIVTIKDLKSTNGTYVNGVKIQQSNLNPGDKISLFDCILDFQTTAKFDTSNFETATHNPPSLPGFQGNLALQTQHSGQPQTQLKIAEYTSTQTVVKPASNLSTVVQNYMNQVVLPGVYKLGENSEFKWVIGSFIIGFIALVTILSVVPMIEITKSGIQKESQRRAEMIAQTMADRYYSSVKQGTEATFDTRSIEREAGVKYAYIISSDDGHIIAPLRRAGEKPNEPFIHRARKTDDTTIEQINNSLIGASVPIKSFSQDAGSYTVTSHAIVLYDMGSLAVDNGRTLSLFVQILTIALFIGFIVYYFMYKFIEYPFSKINAQLNKVLKNEINNVELKFEFPVLQSLLSHINTIIHRSNNPNPSGVPVALFDKSDEAKSIIQIIDSPAIAFDKNLNIISMNGKFEDLVGLRGGQVDGQPLEGLGDQALILSLKDLFERFHKHTETPLINTLEFSGQNYEFHLKVIHGDQDINFFIVVAKSSAGGGFNV